MTELTDAEREYLPDYQKISSITEREFKIHKVKPDDQVFWIENDRGYHISFIVSHVSPDSNLGAIVQTLSENDYVTLSAVRLRKGEGYIPRWYLTEITGVRSSQGPEKNVFS
jgi:hypothetical protein